MAAAAGAQHPQHHAHQQRQLDPLLQAPYTVQLDPESARNLAAHGGTMLLLDVPEGTPIGLDQQVCSCVRACGSLSLLLLLLPWPCRRHAAAAATAMDRGGRSQCMLGEQRPHAALAVLARLATHPTATTTHTQHTPPPRHPNHRCS
jgi:hypothetical protein